MTGRYKLLFPQMVQEAEVTKQRQTYRNFESSLYMIVEDLARFGLLRGVSCGQDHGIGHDRGSSLNDMKRTK